VKLAAARLGAQGLARPCARSAAEVVGRLLAVQAQDGRGARLAVRARSTGLTAASVDRALTQERALVVNWLHRGTMHLVTAADYWWLHRLLAPRQVAANEHRLRQEGVSAKDAARGVEVIGGAIDEDGPQTRSQLRDRLQQAGVPTEGQALVHVLHAASIHRQVVRGPMAGAEQAFVSAPSWLGPAPADLARDEALARLAGRYLAGHGPAGPQDLATWAGIPVGDARRGLDTAGTAVAEGLVDLAGRAEPGPLPGPRLLGPFDPLMHGWKSRSLFVGPHKGVVTTNGVFRPVALVEGRVVATWSLPGGVPTLRPLEPVGAPEREALAADAADVLRYLGLREKPLVIEAAA